MDKKKLRSDYSERITKYKKLAINIREALTGFLNEKEIDFVEIQYRIKSFDSFCEKISRKKYNDPFSEIKDLCGLRIILYYESDIKLINNILRSEFSVINIEDKKESLGVDRFGYRSLHYAIKLPDAWLKAPNYRGLDGLFAEIQIRTILMHAWAAISHKLSYKKEEDIPIELRRVLFRLSALIELADQQFDILKLNRTDYINSLVEVEAHDQKTFNIKAPLNIDTLKSLLGFICPDRFMSDGDLSGLSDELRLLEIGLEDIYKGYKKAKDFISEIEEETYSCMGDKFIPSKDKMHMTGFVRTILDVTSKKYLDWRISDKHIPLQVEKMSKKWMKKLDRESQASAN